MKCLEVLNMIFVWRICLKNILYWFKYFNDYSMIFENNDYTCIQRQLFRSNERNQFIKVVVDLMRIQVIDVHCYSACLNMCSYT